MDKHIKSIEYLTKSYTIDTLYIQNGKLRYTYYIHNPYISKGARSSYHANGLEIVDDVGLDKIIALNSTERQIDETLRSKGYFLVGVYDGEIPEYIHEFMENYNTYIDDFTIKKINRTGPSKEPLLYLKLNIESKAKKEKEKITKFINDILRR